MLIIGDDDDNDDDLLCGMNDRRKWVSLIYNLSHPQRLYLTQAPTWREQHLFFEETKFWLRKYTLIATPAAALILGCFRVGQKGNTYSQVFLTNFSPIFHLYTPCGFLTFSRVIKMENWIEWVKFFDQECCSRIFENSYRNVLGRVHFMVSSNRLFSMNSRCLTRFFCFSIANCSALQQFWLVKTLIRPYCPLDKFSKMMYKTYKNKNIIVASNMFYMRL